MANEQHEDVTLPNGELLTDELAAEAGQRAIDAAVRHAKAA